MKNAVEGRIECRRRGDYTLLRVIGDADTGDLRNALLSSVAAGSYGVLCDVSEAAIGSPVVEAMQHLHGYARAWPGTQVALIGAPADTADRLALQCDRVILTHTLSEAVRALAQSPVPRSVSAFVQCTTTASRSARDMVTRACLDWEASPLIGSACVVASELVTNAMLHGKVALKVSLAILDGRLRICVEDGRPVSQSERMLPSESISGRSLLIVRGLSRDWGVLPTWGGGRALWAVLDTREPRAS